MMEVRAMWVLKLKDVFKHPFLLLAVVGFWFAYAFDAYLSALTPFHLLHFHLRRVGMYDVLLVLWFAA